MSDFKTTPIRVDVSGVPIYVRSQFECRHLSDVDSKLAHMKMALYRIVKGCEAVLLDALLAEHPVHPDVLKKVLDDARAGLGKEQTP